MTASIAGPELFTCKPSLPTVLYLPISWIIFVVSWISINDNHSK